MSRPAVPTTVINKFVIANVRWHVDAEFELHRRHDERACVAHARRRLPRARRQPPRQLTSVELCWRTVS